jgi:hypothetical protein
VSVDTDEATIGQIHGYESAPFVLLIYQPGKQRVALKLYDSPTSGAWDETVIDPDVTLNQSINYTLSFKDDVVTASVNGKTISVKAGSAWDKYPVKFSLGAYSAAPNTGNPPGDETKVTFESFSVSH